MAKAGYTPPPVPPADTNSRSIVDRSNLERLAPRDIEQDPDGGQCAGQVRPAIREERQGVAGERQQPQQDRHVDQSLNADVEGDPGRQELRQLVGGSEGDAETPRHQQREQDDDQYGPQQTQLFANDGEDRIGVRRREQAELLAAGAQPAAEDPTRVQRLERVLHVIGGLIDIDQAGGELVPARPASVRQADKDVAHHPAPERDDQRLRRLGAGQIEHHQGHHRRREHHAQIRLQEDQPVDDAQDHHQRQEPVAPFRQPVTLRTPSTPPGR